MEDLSIDSLSQKIAELLSVCDQLNDENRALKAQEADWQAERARLMSKNEQAKVKVEAMIGRLKALEQSQ